jgi:hypothetical protein
VCDLKNLENGEAKSRFGPERRRKKLVEHQNIITPYVLVYFGGRYLVRVTLLEVQPIRVLAEAVAILEQVLFYPCIPSTTGSSNKKKTNQPFDELNRATKNHPTDTPTELLMRDRRHSSIFAFCTSI